MYYYIIKSHCFSFSFFTFFFLIKIYLSVDVFAYNPTSSEFSYHSNNRKLEYIDFFSSQVLTTYESTGQRLAKLAHGFGMLIIWRYDMILMTKNK